MARQAFIAKNGAQVAFLFSLDFGRRSSRRDLGFELHKKKEKVMRNYRQLMRRAALGAAIFLVGATRSNAQIVGSTGVNPFTGQISSSTTGYNPLTNQIGSSNLVINPVTGQQLGVGISQNPLTGTIYRTDIVRNPLTGATVSYQQRYNPLLNRYRWRANIRP
jgi:Tfp pilus tip-associated adhesin PilY1